MTLENCALYLEAKLAKVAHKEPQKRINRGAHATISKDASRTQR